MKMRKLKVLVALSGGADSAVAAGLLQRSGFQVEGAFMKLTDDQNLEKGWLAAQAIAERLNFPLRVFDFRLAFLQEVIQPSLENYRRGLTPNPCVLCNHRLKLDLFLQKAQAAGFPWVASGHYLRKSRGVRGFRLWRAKDKKKDQSYFLWRLDQERLAHLLFPLGTYLRSQVEALIKDWKLGKIIRPASQNLCFIKQGMRDFLREKLGEKTGAIVDLKGKVLGYHSGLWFYTLGQRRDLGLLGGPFYVVGKNISKNHLLVSQKRKDLVKERFQLKEVNWIQGREPSLPYAGKIKIRYQAEPRPGIITRSDSSLYSCQSSQEAVTPGQSAVIYQRKEMIGGGIIINQNNV